MTNRIIANHASMTPEIGMGVTEILWTDRNPYTVVEIITAKKIVIQEDSVVRKPFPNGYAESITPNPNGYKVTIKLMKDGRWRTRANGTIYRVGNRDFYSDPSF